jgi:hypothetical protein
MWRRFLPTSTSIVWFEIRLLSTIFDFRLTTNIVKLERSDECLGENPKLLLQPVFHTFPYRNKVLCSAIFLNLPFRTPGIGTDTCSSLPSSSQ